MIIQARGLLVVRFVRLLQCSTLSTTIVFAAACNDELMVQASRGMEPLIVPGQTIKVSKVSGNVYSSVSRGDVVVIKLPQSPSDARVVTRVVAFPEEKVYLDGSGTLIVNDAAVLPKKYAPRYYFVSDPEIRFAVARPYTVPRGHFFVLGDNTKHVRDSRYFGPVPGKNIIGVYKHD